MVIVVLEPRGKATFLANVAAVNSQSPTFPNGQNLVQGHRSGRRYSSDGRIVITIILYYIVLYDIISYYIYIYIYIYITLYYIIDV